VNRPSSIERKSSHPVTPRAHAPRRGQPVPHAPEARPGKKGGQRHGRSQPRRTTLGLGAGAALASAAPPSWRAGAATTTIQRAEVEPLRLPIESGASLRIIRPARFVEPDEVIFRRNAARFSEEYNIPIRVDFVGWEDIRLQTAVIANTGAGPDIVIGWGEDQHVYADKLIESPRILWGSSASASRCGGSTSPWASRSATRWATAIPSRSGSSGRTMRA
jgi:hypothetical protein